MKIATTAAVAASGLANYGQAITFTATITPASGSGETRDRTVPDRRHERGSPVAVSGNTATYTTSAVNAGSHTIVAVYNGDGKFSGSTSNTLGVAVGKATLTITANNAGKAFGTRESLDGTAFTQTGLVTANGDSITGVSETCTGCPAAAAVGSYSIVPSAATGTGLGNYNIAYVNGSLAVAQATDLVVTTGTLMVTSASNLADGCSLTVGSFTASPVIPAAIVATAPMSTSALPSDSYVSGSPLMLPNSIIRQSVRKSGARAPFPIIGENAVAAAMFGSGDQWYSKSSAIVALDLVLAEYGQRD